MNKNNNSLNICLIPARGGSKRIPRKNIKEFNGKPFIAWSIEAALSSDLFSDVYVSSDDDEIIKIAEDFGAKIPFVRPSNLADDFTKDKEVIDHFLNHLEEKKIMAEYLCYLYPTAPFIDKNILQGCLNMIKKKGVKEVFTMTTFPYPPQKSLKLDSKEGLIFNWEEYKGTRSQDLEPLFHDAGQCYFFNLNKKLDNNIRLGFQIPRYKCQDIDTFEDFENLKKLFKIFKTRNSI